MDALSFGPLFGLAIFPGLMIAAALCDLLTLTIPNRLCLAAVLAFIPCAVIAHLSLTEIGIHLLIALAALAFGILGFAMRWMGGGDGKFLAASALWFGPSDIILYAVAFSIAGGLLALALISLRQIPIPLVLNRQDWIQRLWTGKAGVPYALAFAAGGLFVYPQTEIWRRLLGS
jgi:prepilin peptidase CpaA